MTISTTSTTVSYAGNGSSVAFSVPFPFFTSSELTVQSVVTATGIATSLTLTTDYAVTGGDGSTGTVTMVTAPATGTTLVIRRFTNRTQDIDLLANDNLPSETLERGMDRSVALHQESLETLNRTLRGPTHEGALSALPSWITRALGYLGFDSAGQPTIFAGAVASTSISSAMLPVVQAATLALGRAALGLTAIGEAIATAASAAAARTSLGALAAASGSATSLSVDGLNGGALAGFRNRIINGGMAVDEVNAGASQTFTAGAALAYSVDQWYGYCTGANVSGARTAASGARRYTYRFTGAASVTAIGFAQRIAQEDCFDLVSTTATLSLDLANSLLTTVNWALYYANTADTFGTLAAPTRTSIASGSFTVTSTITRYNAQISIPAGASTGLELVLSVGAQVSGTWDIGNVQLEPGSVATPFERRPYGEELRLCQRYFYKLQADIAYSGYATAGGQGTFIMVPLPVRMRATPTNTPSFGASINISGNTVNAYTSHITHNLTSSAAGIMATTLLAGNTYAARL
jgi:hypothetical protein